MDFKVIILLLKSILIVSYLLVTIFQPIVVRITSNFSSKLIIAMEFSSFVEHRIE